jgi:soluble lytic murein transglycosylase-like protein
VKFPFLQAACSAAIVFVCAGAHADSDLQTLEDRTSSTIPHVLSGEDVRLYRELFADERSGNFAAARRQVEELSDRSLVGYAEAEHFLSPRARHIPLDQLAAWLEKYDDLPLAPRVRELAEKHNRRHRIELAAIPPIHVRGGWGYETADTRPEAPLASDAGRAAETAIESDIRADQPGQAEAVLQTLATTADVPSSDITQLTHKVAAGYLAEGRDNDAYRLAMTVTGTDRAAVPQLDWVAGLAAYRQSNFADAAQRFETLAQSGDATGWARSAAAFWAARAHLAAGDPLKVVTLLTAAAREQPTFYGLLAEQLLGQEDRTQFSEPTLDTSSFQSIVQNEAAHRAVALWQIGETDYVQPEMMRALGALSPDETAAFAALAHRMDLPDLELRASETQASHGVTLTGLFPMPRYAPPGGYQVDPCLLFAFARVESRFEAKAVSTAGARGVMQVMPDTAQHVDGATPDRSRLNNPAYNLGLGQKYLQELIGQVNGNLFQLAAAYNAGPAALTRWIGARPSIADDPLLFIESIPVAETRNYIKRVMTMYWLYDRRAGRSIAPSLEETAEGKWPVYHPHQSPITAPPPPAVAGTTLISDASVPH